MEWRFFKEDDLEWILKATKDMFDESEWNDGEYDKEKIKRYFLERLINSNRSMGQVSREIPYKTFDK